MPQRTNAFQELVSLIKKALARDGDTVEDSAMVSVRGLETEREIDILHKTSDGFSTIKISVEARDEGRKIDVTTFEELCAKYRGEGRVCVDKFMIVSRHGFTEGAIEKAKLLDVPLLTLDEAKEFDWSKTGPEHRPLQGVRSLVVKVPPRVQQIQITPPLPAALEKAIIQEGRVVCPTCSGSRDHGSLKEYVEQHTVRRTDAEAIGWFKALEEASRNDPGKGVGMLRATLKEGFRVRFQGVEYPLQELCITIEAINASGQMRSTPYQLTSSEGGSRLVQHMSAQIGNTKFDFILPDGLKSKKIPMKVSTPTAKERFEQRKKKRRRNG